MNIDMKGKNNMSDMLPLVRQLYERFNLNYGNYIDINKVDDAIKNIIIVSDTNVQSREIKTRFSRGAKAFCENGKIYIKEDISIDVLFHEILHYITDDHKGIQIPFVTSYSDEEIDELIDKYGENRFIYIIEQFDESMTRFITELAIPEVEINDSYQYGANVIRKYYEGLINNGSSVDFIFNMYLNGNQNDFMKFKESFGNKFLDVLSAIEKANNVRYYLFKQSSDKTISNDEVDLIVNDAVNMLMVK